MTAGGITQLFVELQRGLILGCDDGVDLSKTLKGEDFFQGTAESFADAPALCFGAQIHRIFGAPAVSSPLEGSAAVGIAKNFALLFPHQPGESGGDITEAPEKFFFGRDGVFKSISGG